MCAERAGGCFYVWIFVTGPGDQKYTACIWGDIGLVLSMRHNFPHLHFFLAG
jgi:hypothetical protein